ncbi:MAG: nuclear transport factor 2 family protein [Rhodobacter sp.]|nr:nuclear transport factor 2 family protein [Rhodobacter sp.]
MSDALNSFFAAWTMTEDEGRDDQIASAFGNTVYYVDPRTEAPLSDMAALCGYVGQFLPMCPPGARVEVADPVDVNSGHARATVNFIMSDEMRQQGQYFADLDANGKITRLVGFVGKGAE